jgi:hypothetical protein
VGRFGVPFRETIKPIFEEMTGLQLYKSKNYEGFWRSLKTEEEFLKVKSWIDDQGERVFLRDTLALSMALSLNFTEEGRHTAIGEIEYRAKYQKNQKAISDLVQILLATRGALALYKDARTICAVPPSPNKDFDLPTIIADRLAQLGSLKNVTQAAVWTKNKPSLKGIAVNEKWSVLEQASLEIRDKLKGETILLVDDLYQSGITMQFVAMKLLQSGAKSVYGLSIVKSLRDTDNQ